MFKKFTTGALNAKMHWQLFKMLLLVSNTASLVIYAALHFILFDFPFETINELLILGKMFSVASAFALLISTLILITDVVEYFVHNKYEITLPAYFKRLALALSAAIVLLYACKAPSTAGVKKDFNTGLVSTYSALEPEKAFLIMNGEVLNHTDIPLGESFLLVNDNIKGFEVKDGKVTVGCSLTITDEKGKALLQEKDLFAGHDIFEEKNAKMLKCTVTTGEPMKWEENYNVAVVFWDKNGKGKIENKLTIRSIDIP